MMATGTLSGDLFFDVTYGGTLSGLEPPRATLRPQAPGGTLSGDAGGGIPPEAEEAGAPEGLRTPDFEVGAEIGRGGMGVVFRATQLGLGREVALKVLRPELEGGPAGEKFAAEALVTGRLEHPSIPPVHVFDRDERGRAYLAMKLVRGLAWSDLLKPATREARERASAMDLRGHLEILRRACEAVAYAHSRGVIHRDLKPENVMVGEFGEVLVMDWGIALEFPVRPASAHGGLRRPVGTPAYMAPEMAACRDEELGPWTDVYLLGGILYEILTGSPPHEGESVFEVLIRAREGKVEPPAARAPEKKIDATLAEIAMRALDPDPKKRYASPMDLAAAIDEYYRHESAMALADFGQAELDAAAAAIATRQAKPSEVYGRFSGATAALRQAEETWPENRAIAERLARARVAYAAYALEAGDLALAEAQLDRAGGAAPGAADVRGRLLAERALREAEARRRRRLLLGFPLVLVIAALVASFAWRASRRAGELEAARERRERAQAEIEKASWGDYEAKVAAAERAVMIDPTWAEGYGELGRAYKDLESYPSTSSTDAEKLTQAYERAVWAFDRSLALKKDVPLTLSDRGWSTAMLGDWKTALEFYRRCAALDKVGHEGMEAAGLVALDAGRFAEAAEKFSRCIEIDPQQMDYFERAIARYGLGDLDGALADAEKVLSMAPTDEWYSSLVALVRIGRGEMREAGETLVAALKIHDEGPHLLTVLAYRAARLGDRERAAGAMEKARASHKKYARAFLALEPWFSALARAPGTLAEAGRAMLLDLDLDKAVAPNQAISLKLRRDAEACLRAADGSGALGAATRALAEDPADGAALLARARALLALGHRGAALEDLAFAAILAPERAGEVKAVRASAGDEAPEGGGGARK
jgi:Tfp pilus assembly protein PilF